MVIQLHLPFPRSKEALRDCLEKLVKKSISLTITDNSSSMISMRRNGKSFSVRLHWMFLHAGNDVIREMAEFIKRRGGKTPCVNKFVSENHTLLKEKAHRIENTKVKGKYYNLKELFDSINKEYFERRVDAKISWGRMKKRFIVKRRTLGSYSSHSNTIWINPILDKKNVPRYFLKFVIYHEMLHSDMKEDNKRKRSIHSAEFRRRERLFMDYERAVSWEKRH